MAQPQTQAAHRPYAVISRGVEAAVRKPPLGVANDCDRAGAARLGAPTALTTLSSWGAGATGSGR
jgi:hypothetical protein